MYIKFSGLKCECGNLIELDYNELCFHMIDGEIFENQTDDMTCNKCGNTYRLEDMEFKPEFKKVK